MCYFTFFTFFFSVSTSTVLQPTFFFSSLLPFLTSNFFFYSKFKKNFFLNLKKMDQETNDTHSVDNEFKSATEVLDDYIDC